MGGSEHPLRGDQSASAEVQFEPRRETHPGVSSSLLVPSTESPMSAPSILAVLMLPEERLQPIPRMVAAVSCASVGGVPEGPIHSTLEGRWLGEARGQPVQESEPTWLQHEAHTHSFDWLALDLNRRD